MIVGAVTVLVVIVAVFLAYNANNGLPFVSTYDLKARVPNANALVKGNEVRIGGVARRAIVKSVVPVQIGDGRVAAELDLSLDKNAEPLPVELDDDHPPEVPARPQVPADHPRRLLAKASRPAKRSRSPRRSPEPVDIDQFFDMFDEEDPRQRSSATWPASATPSPAAARS